MKNFKKISAAGFVVLMLSISSVWQTASAAETWVGTWATGEQTVETTNNPASPGLQNNTLRQVVHATVGGSRIRVHFSNKYTTSGGALTINSAHIALAASNTLATGAIVTSTDTALTFNSGSSSATIAAGAELYSDAVDFNLPPLSNVSISIYFGTASSSNVTGHPGSRTTYYLQTGNTVSAADMSSAAKAAHWYVISRLEVWRDDSYGCVVALGDSITDGRTTSGNDNTNYRWCDIFAAKLQADPATAKIGVINQGIGGNCIVSGGLGPTALNRFDHDVTGQPGVRWAIIFEGTNDIGGGTSSSSIISAYQTMITKAHNAGILIYGATITPFKNHSYYAHESTRDAVNTWIRTSGQFDGVLDFDAVVRDPADQDQINPIYQFEWLHFNPAGYAVMGNSIDLYLFKNSANLDETGSVDFVDFAYLAAQWRQTPGDPSADIAPHWGDGAVDLNDLFLMSCEWLKDE